MGERDTQKEGETEVMERADGEKRDKENERGGEETDAKRQK